MEFAAQLIDFVLHVDRYLEEFVKYYDSWIYLLLFVIVFLEAGVVLTPFLPGDSLLFVVGGICAVGLMDWTICCVLLSTAGAVGGQFNYWMGSKLGTTLMKSHSRWFGEREFQKTQDLPKEWDGTFIATTK